MKELIKILLTVFVIHGFLCLAACKSGNSRGDSATDETEKAAAIIIEANKSLKEIKVLYSRNENKRQELKDAMLADDENTVKKIADDVVYLINDGVKLGKSALDQIAEARVFEVNEDYENYLRLKEDALTLQLEAFEQYRQAAITLRDNYDPKNTDQRDKVKAKFESHGEKYRDLMEKARESSKEANEIAKAALRNPETK